MEMRGRESLLPKAVIPVPREALVPLCLFFFFFFVVRGPLPVGASPVAEYSLRTRRPSGHGSRTQPLRGM